MFAYSSFCSRYNSPFPFFSMPAFEQTNPMFGFDSSVFIACSKACFSKVVPASIITTYFVVTCFKAKLHAPALYRFVSVFNACTVMPLVCGNACISAYVVSVLASSTKYNCIVFNVWFVIVWYVFWMFPLSLWHGTITLIICYRLQLFFCFYGFVYLVNRYD